MARWSLRQAALTILAVFVVLAVAAALVWRDDILESFLDPKVPYQTYQPPKAPDYARRKAWALLPADAGRATASDPPVDVFFVHPTTFDGGDNWNAPIQNDKADDFLARVMLPNYAGPFQRVGRVFAPRYRAAALYAFLNMRDDARDARTFAYGDVSDAFKYYLRRLNQGRPIILVGVEQGGQLAARLAREVIGPDPQLRNRTVAVYLIDVVTPKDAFPPASLLPACEARDEAHCVVAWKAVFADDRAAVKRVLDRALVWDDEGSLSALGNRPPLCVNPLFGAETSAPAPARLNLGAANATGMEWGARPAFLPHQVSARCVDGLLHVSRPASPALRPSGSWADRKKAPAYNLFYADEETDAKARIAALLGAH
jgi:hypothetical protein